MQFDLFCIAYTFRSNLDCSNYTELEVAGKAPSFHTNLNSARSKDPSSGFQESLMKWPPWLSFPPWKCWMGTKSVFESTVNGQYLVKENLTLYFWRQNLNPILFQYQTDDFGEASNREERRIERMIRKTGRDIYRLRKTKTSGGSGRPPGDIISFK